MGHHAGSKSSIIPLIDRLNKYPIGLPDSETLRKILALLFDEEEAYIASRFPLEEATLEELAKATKLAAKDLQAKLERMAEKGLVMDLPYAGKTYYLLMPGLIGFFEFSFMKHREDLPQDELARLMHSYMHDNPKGGMAREFFGSSPQLTRTLVYEDRIPVSSEVTSYENARKIIEEAGFGAVGMCYCRHKKEHLDESCRRGVPVEETCISLGNASRFLVRRGFAEERTVPELLAILDRARSYGLTHVTDNIRQKPTFICNCCQCCCELMAGVQAGYADGVAKTPFLARIAEDDCNGCGACVKVCNVRSISLAVRGEGRVAVVDEASCLGCGACLPSCARQALSLVERDRRPEPPGKRKELMMAILKEKGRLTPFIVSGAKKRLGGMVRGRGK